MTKRALVLVLFVLILAIPIAYFDIGAEGGLDFQRLDAVLEERGLLASAESEQPVTVRLIGFDRQAGAAHGFHGDRGVKDVVANTERGVLQATVIERDNLVVGDVSLDSAEVTGIVLRLRVSRSSTHSWLLWAGAGEPLDRSRGRTFRADAGETFHSYFIPVEDSPEWKGSINRLAISIGVESADLPASVEIDEIRAVRASFLARRRLEGTEGALDRAEIAGETRRIVYSPAPGVREATVTVPPGGILTFGYGVLPSCWYKPGDGVTFRASVVDGEKSPVVLTSRYVDPKSRPADRRWFDESVSLADYSGRTVRLKFETIEGAPQAQGDPRFDDAVWSSPVLAAPRRGRAPNVVVILLDTVRADHLSLYGYRRGTSPRLEALANESLVFRWAYAPAPETIQSVMSILTSQYPTTHGVISFSDRLRAGTPTLADRLSAAGFHTVAITEGGSVAADFGFDQGFDRYVDATKTGATPARPNKFIEQTFDRALSFLREIGDRRFFLFLHTYEPHVPYCAPMRPERDFDPQYRGPFAGGVAWEEVQKALLEKRLAPGTPDALHIAAAYDAGLHYTDEWVGKVVDEMRARGLLDDTILVVTSDHGEDLFDHIATATHGHTLYEELIRVPLLVRMPDAWVAAQGSQAAPLRGLPMIENPVSLIDLFPTLMEALELPRVTLPRGEQRASFLPLLWRERVAERPVFAEDQSLFRRYAVRMPAVQRSTPAGPERVVEKLIDSPGIESHPMTAQLRAHENLRLERFQGILKERELYDLVGDPKEMNNLLGSRVPAEETQRQLYRFISGLMRSRPYGSTTVKVSAETLERLRALGYLR
jgi:arylsulfatase A-like enzyme